MKNLLLLFISTVLSVSFLAQETDKSANIVTEYFKMGNLIYLKTNNYNKNDPHTEVFLNREDLNLLKSYFDSAEELIFYLGKDKINGFITGIENRNSKEKKVPSTSIDFMITLTNGKLSGIYEDFSTNKKYIYINGKKLDYDLKIKTEKEIIIEAPEPMIVKKPIIYLYPKEKTDIEVQLNFVKNKLFTYPQIQNDTWKISADENGNIFDYNTKRDYYSLFWEIETYQELKINEGNVVSNKELRPFLEESLEQLGLNDKELNEFMIFWLPELEKNKYNLIHFSLEEYSETFPITITPQPDTFIRIFMAFTPLDENNLTIKKQILPSKPKRDGFTVIEWGGMEVGNKLKNL